MGGRIPWNVNCYLRNSQDRLSGEKTLYEKRFGECLKGPSFPFGSLVEYPPISTKDQSRIHKFGQKYSQESSSVMCCLQRESGKETYWLWTLKSWKRWTHRKSMLKDSTQKTLYCLEVVKIVNYQSQMGQYDFMKEIRD